VTAPRETDRVSDEWLVAYLDGELPPDQHAAIARRIAGDAELQRRLLVLSGGNRPFKQAFAPLLAQAPEERMEAMFSRLSASQRVTKASPWRVVRAIAAAIVLFAAGLTADRLIPDLSESLEAFIPGTQRAQDDDDDWRQAVAEYLTLYSADTLSSIPDDDAMRQRELETLRSRLAINLSLQQLATSNLSFKRAQLFEYEGKPLGQIAYLDPDSGPVALCLIKSEGSNASPQVEQRQGFNIVYWTQSGHDFMVIGRMPVSRLQDLAAELSGRLAG